MTRSDEATPRMGMIFTGVGLICLGIGIYGIVDSVLFGRGAETSNATRSAVERNHRSDSAHGDYTLEFAVAGRQYQVPARGTFGVLILGKPDPFRTDNRHIPVLYPPERPEQARVALFVPRFGIPLMLIVLGCMFAPIAVFTHTRGNVPRIVKLCYAGFFVLAGLTGAVLGIVGSLRQ